MFWDARRPETAYIVGLLGFLMRRFDMPVAPVLVGMILGPLAEQQFRRALAISQGDLSVFIAHPISATVKAPATCFTNSSVVAARVIRCEIGTANAIPAEPERSGDDGVRVSDGAGFA